MKSISSFFIQNNKPFTLKKQAEPFHVVNYRFSMKYTPKVFFRKFYFHFFFGNGS